MQLRKKASFIYFFEFFKNGCLYLKLISLAAWVTPGMKKIETLYFTSVSTGELHIRLLYWILFASEPFNCSILTPIYFYSQLSSWGCVWSLYILILFLLESCIRSCYAVFLREFLSAWRRIFKVRSEKWDFSFCKISKACCFERGRKNLASAFLHWVWMFMKDYP